MFSTTIDREAIIPQPELINWPNATLVQIKEKPQTVHNESSSRLKRYYIQEGTNRLIIELDPTKVLPLVEGKTKLKVQFTFANFEEWRNPFRVRPVKPHGAEEKKSADQVDTVLYGKFIKMEDVNDARLLYFDFCVLSLDNKKAAFRITDRQFFDQKLHYNGQCALYLTWVAE